MQFHATGTYSKSRIEIGKSLFVWVFILAMIVALPLGSVEQSSVVAEPNENTGTIVEQSLAPSEPNENIGTVVDDISAAEVEISASGKLKFIGFDKDKCKSIRDALRVLAAQCKKNIVPSSKVDGPLTVSRLYDVTFEQALDAILGHGFKYEQDGNFIKVYTSEEYKKMMEDKDRMIYRIFTLYYISAAEAMKLLAPVLSGAGLIQGSSPAATLVPTGESITMGSAGGDTMALNDTIIIQDYPENIELAEKLLTELDIRPRQVLVEATILSATLTEETALGIDWSTLNGVSIDTIANIGKGIADGLATGGFASSVKTTASSGGFSAGITSDHVAVLIRALESVTDITIHANPKILAVNKQLGQVYIGNKIGYVSQTTQTQTSTTQQVEFLDTGTKLSFRPYIGNDGYIRMDIHPKDSSGTLKANDIPDESSTELATNIMVKDGQTIVIGGLFRDVVTTTRNQVPLLGDLPFVGAAFRGTMDKSQRQEVIVMLTPHIIEEPEETKGEARVHDISRKRFGAKDELQWIDRTRLAEDHYKNAAKCYLEGDSESAMQELNKALELRPAYLEAIRLKERIIGETSPEDLEKIGRMFLNKVEKEDSQMWQRR